MSKQYELKFVITTKCTSTAVVAATACSRVKNVATSVHTGICFSRTSNEMKSKTGSGNINLSFVIVP